ncbi:MAG TPA: type II secretion system protein [Patescibacteria group bacterium]|nr:type II secretion system protein [Patescibacteria group bacterium]
MKKGFTLLEILVVTSVFAVLGVLVTRSVILSVTGSKKSESIVRVRENLDYTSSIIERQLRNAISVSECPNTDPLVLSYIDQVGEQAGFSCLNMGVDTVGYVASGSATPARLTSEAVDILECSFSCQPGVGNNPAVVTVFLNAKDSSAVGIQGAEVSSTTQISLRNY